VGLALKQTKLSLGNSFTHRLWKGIYHIFGDPKFGAVSGSGAGAAAATEAETGGASVIEIDIPDYEVTEIDGQDHVEIPGGLVLRQTGTPAVPYLKMLYHFPAGYQIQDVALVERSHRETSSGLELPLSTLGVLGCCEPDYEVEPPVIPSWWPEKIYDWTVQESSTTTTLALTVYPFHYNHQTTEAEFFKYFRFDVEYIESEVEVVHLATDKQTYAPGESVLIDFMLNNASTQAQDVVMEAVVKQAGSQEFVSGLLLHTLKDFVGQASWSTEWDSDSFPPGYYSVHVILKDTLGVLLDRKIETFRLGVSSGEIASLDVAPQYFDIGDRIDVDMNFTNSGSIDLDGTAVIKVLDANGETVQEFFHEMTNLAPGSTIGFNDTWETSAASPGPYHVMGFGYYDGGATEPAVELISTTNCLFDLDHDGDVDGKDLADVVEKFGDHFGPEDLPGLSSTLGRSNCFELD
jgi:hypothetical protein